jgi:hypothetical protein
VYEYVWVITLLCVKERLKGVSINQPPLSNRRYKEQPFCYAFFIRFALIETDLAAPLLLAD